MRPFNLGSVAMSFALAIGSAHAAVPGYLLVANKGDQTLGIIDPNSGKQIATVAENGVTGHEVAASPDGRFAFVPIFGSGGVGGPGTDGQVLRIIDIQKKAIVATVDFGKGVRPHDPVFNPNDGLLYVTTELENSVSIIDPKTAKIVGSVPTGQPESHMLAISKDGKRGYNSNVGPGTISVLDLSERKQLGTIQVSAKAQRISLSVDDRYLFTADQTKPQLAVVDIESRSVKTWVSLEGNGYGTAPTPDGKWLLVAVPRLSKVTVVDLNSYKVVRSLDVSKYPQEVVIRPDGAVAYVSCDNSGQVAELDLKDWKTTRFITAGPGADGLAWAAAKAPQQSRL